MPTPKRGPRLGGGPAHQKALMSNLASDLIRHGRIRTTETKAKALRPYAEKLITKARVGDLHNRRQVLSTLRDRDVVAYLFEEVAPRFVDRPGGYTRIIKLDPRPGDNARMAVIELVDRGAASGEEFIEESKSQRSRGLFGRLRRRGGGEPTGPGAAAYTSGDEDADADAATVDEATDVTEDELVEATEAPVDESTTPADVQDAIDEVADPESDADSIAEALGEGGGQEGPPVERDAVKAEGSEPGDPNDPSVGVPVDETGNVADAGESSGKDAGEK